MPVAGIEPKPRDLVCQPHYQFFCIILNHLDWHSRVRVHVYASECRFHVQLFSYIGVTRYTTSFIDTGK